MNDLEPGGADRPILSSLYRVEQCRGQEPKPTGIDSTTWRFACYTVSMSKSMYQYDTVRQMIVGGAREAAAALLELEANNCEHEKDAVTQSQLLKPCMGMVDDTTKDATRKIPVVVRLLRLAIAA
jgi:hypothetical protein